MHLLTYPKITLMWNFSQTYGAYDGVFDLEITEGRISCRIEASTDIGHWEAGGNPSVTVSQIEVFDMNGDAMAFDKFELEKLIIKNIEYEN